MFYTAARFRLLCGAPKAVLCKRGPSHEDEPHTEERWSCRPLLSWRVGNQEHVVALRNSDQFLEGREAVWTVVELSVKYTESM
jgi:hypothetical protein